MSAMSPNQLSAIAGEMNAMVVDSDASVHYDLFSDALHWSDEIPELGTRKPRDYWCLRPVLRYRTTIILGAPDGELEEFWTEARAQFPHWPGFQLSRCRQDGALAELYHRLRADGMDSAGDLRSELH